MGRYAHAPTLSTLLSNQARGSSVDRMNPLLGLLRFKRCLRERASQIDDCHLWSRKATQGQNSAYGLLEPTAKTCTNKTQWRRRACLWSRAAAAFLHGIYLKLFVESIMLDQAANKA